MLKQGTKRFAVSITLLSIVVLFSAGCDKYGKQKVLTFFFTGVPPLEWEGTAALVVNPEPGNTVEADMEQKNMISTTHGPFDAGQCDLCHILKKKAEKKKEFGGMPGLGELPKELIVPKQELCIQCHVTKSIESAAERNLWLHGPVSTGLCTACHHHHRSVFPFMLKAKSVDLCAQCHVGGSIIETEDHLSGKECISCHNAHLGKNRFLLRKDYLEIY